MNQFPASYQIIIASANTLVFMRLHWLPELIKYNQCTPIKEQI